MQKSKTYTLLAAMSMFMVLAAPLCAQSTRFKGEIPFEFIAGGKTMPAGEYTVGTTSPSGVQLIITGVVAGHKESAQFLTNSEKADGDSRLVFNRYGNQYFLSQVVAGGRGWHTVTSQVERELAKQVPAHQRETVTVLAKR